MKKGAHCAVRYLNYQNLKNYMSDRSCVNKKRSYLNPLWICNPRKLRNATKKWRDLDFHRITYSTIKTAYSEASRYLYDDSRRSQHEISFCIKMRVCHNIHAPLQPKAVPYHLNFSLKQAINKLRAWSKSWKVTLDFKIATKSRINLGVVLYALPLSHNCMQHPWWP